MPCKRGHFMAYIEGERWSTHLVSYAVERTDFRSSVFSDRGVCVPAGHGEAGFVRSEPAETGSPGYEPRDLLKLYLYGYLRQSTSSQVACGAC